LTNINGFLTDDKCFDNAVTMTNVMMTRFDDALTNDKWFDVTDEKHFDDAVTDEKTF